MLISQEEFIKFPQLLALGEKTKQIEADLKKGITNKTFSALEQKIYLCLLQKASQTIMSEKGATDFIIKFTEIKEIFPSLVHYTNDELEKATNELLSTKIRISNSNSKAARAYFKNGCFTDDELGVADSVTFNLISRVARFDTSLKFSLNAELIKLIRDQPFFTKLSVKDLNAIGSSSYAIQLYTITKHYENGYRTSVIPIEKLRAVLGIPDDSYKEYKSLKRSVLKRIVDDINNDTSINITLLERKSGKNVIGIYFEVSKREKDNTIDSMDTNKVLSSTLESMNNGFNIFDGLNHLVENAIRSLAKQKYPVMMRLAQKYRASDAKTVDKVDEEIFLSYGTTTLNTKRMVDEINNILEKKAGYKQAVSDGDICADVKVVLVKKIKGASFELTFDYEGTLYNEIIFNYQEFLDFIKRVKNS